ncbi:prolipoprotein diacylglyceryl transferase [candidate division WOR-3 bacterium]|nr:prolipoprotein diacylglyceryl transferase [candidate division WOR-3 bacterium]
MHPIFLLGPFKMNPWGTMIVIAFISAILVAIIRAKKYKIPPKRVRAVLHFVVLVIIAGFVGARLLCVFEHLNLFLQNPRDIFSIRRGGLSWYGGLLFAFICGFWCHKIRKLPVRVTLDILAPGIALGFFFGRMGCFLRGCCFGKPTQVPWGVVFPSDSYASMVYGGQVKIHPTQLYSSLAGLISFFILLAIERKIKLKLRGLLFFSFLILYGLWRFIIEFFKYHELIPYLAEWFNLWQALSVGLVILGVAMIWLTIKHEQHT